jgi:hypothetical protein
VCAMGGGSQEGQKLRLVCQPDKRPFLCWGRHRLSADLSEWVGAGGRGLAEGRGRAQAGKGHIEQKNTLFVTECKKQREAHKWEGKDVVGSLAYRQKWGKKCQKVHFSRRGGR